MPASQAHVPTHRASRYLAQLCKHSGQMSRITFHQPRGHGVSGTPPVPQHTDWSGTDGVIDLTSPCRPKLKTSNSCNEFRTASPGAWNASAAATG